MMMQGYLSLSIADSQEAAQAHATRMTCLTDLFDTKRHNIKCSLAPLRHVSVSRARLAGILSIPNNDHHLLSEMIFHWTAASEGNATVEPNRREIQADTRKISYAAFRQQLWTGIAVASIQVSQQHLCRFGDEKERAIIDEKMAMKLPKRVNVNCGKWSPDVQGGRGRQMCIEISTSVQLYISRPDISSACLPLTSISIDSRKCNSNIDIVVCSHASRMASWTFTEQANLSWIMNETSPSGTASVTTKRLCDMSWSSDYSQNSPPHRDRGFSTSSVEELIDDYQKYVSNSQRASLLLQFGLGYDAESYKSNPNTDERWTRSVQSSSPDTQSSISNRISKLSFRSSRSPRSSLQPSAFLSDGVNDMKFAREHINNLRRKKNRLEENVKSAREREERLKTQLYTLHKSKTRIEQRLLETIEGKDNLENEVKSLTKVNGKLAQQLASHHSMLNTVEDNKDDLARQIESLQDERQCLHAQLADSHQTILSLQSLNTDRHNQLQLKMRQAAALDNRLLAALDRYDALSLEHAQEVNNALDLEHAHDDAQDRLLRTARMMQAIEESAESHRKQIELLEGREQRLAVELEKTVARNNELESNLNATTANLASVRKSMKSMTDHIRCTEDNLIALQQDAEEKSEQTRVLKHELAQSHLHNSQVLDQLAILQRKLDNASKQNESLAFQLNSVNEEKKKLEDNLDGANGNLKHAEESLTTLSNEFGAFVEATEEQLREAEQEKTSLQEARQLAESRLLAFETETCQLAEVNLSLQHVVNSFGTNHIAGSVTSVSFSPVSGRQSKLSTISREPVIEEGDLAEELCVLQDNMTKLHAILTRIRLRRDMEQFKRLSKRDSATSTVSPRHSPKSGRNFQADSPMRVVVNFSRLGRGAETQSAKERQFEQKTAVHLSRNSPDRTSTDTALRTAARHLPSQSGYSFVDLTDESRSVREPSTPSSVTEASRRLQDGFIEEFKLYPRDPRDIKYIESRNAVSPPLGSPFVAKLKSSPEETRILHPAHNGQRTSQDAIRSAMLRSSVAIIRGTQSPELNLNKALPMSPEEQEKFAAFQFVTPSTHDTPRNSGINKAKMRKFGTSIDRGYPVMAFPPHGVYKSSSGTTSRASSVASLGRCATPVSGYQSPDIKLIEYARNGHRDFDGYSSASSSSSESRRSRETTSTSTRSANTEDAFVNSPGGGRKKRIAKLLGM